MILFTVSQKHVSAMCGCVFMCGVWVCMCVHVIYMWWFSYHKIVIAWDKTYSNILLFKSISANSDLPDYSETLINGTIKFVCEPCGRKYTYKQGLRQHQRYECGKEPQFQCPHCPYKAKQKSTLTAHIALKHLF